MPTIPDIFYVLADMKLSKICAVLFEWMEISSEKVRGLVLRGLVMQESYFQQVFMSGKICICGKTFQGCLAESIETAINCCKYRVW